MLEHALALAARGFYVFPIVAGKKAPPKLKDWQKFATRDLELIEMWWGTPDTCEDNIGISTSKFGDGTDALLVVDIDTKGKADGFETILKLELEGRDFPATVEQRTPSQGMHWIYVVSRGVRQSVNLFPGIDVRSAGGYVVGAGSTVKAGEYSISGGVVTPAPDWLVERCGRARERAKRQDRIPDGVDSSAAIGRVRHYLLNEAPLAIEGEGGDETAYKVAARCKDLGVECKTALELMLDHWNARCSPPWDPIELLGKVGNAYVYGTEPAGIAAPELVFHPGIATPDNTPISVEPIHPFECLNREYAFVIAAGHNHIIRERTDANGRACIEHLDLETFHNAHAAETMQVGKKEQAVTKLWMTDKRRRSYTNGFVFAPQLLTRGGYFNLWKGFAYEPLPPNAAPTQEMTDAVDAFFAHARDNVCRGDDPLCQWLIGYFSHLVQRPWEKPLVALVFRGGKGVGKNALIERVGALLGGHFLVTSNRRYLIGNFNGHLENCLLFALDEAFWSGDKQAEGIIKDLITGSHHVIERKGNEPYTVENRTRISIIGNEDWLAPASHDERRFAVFDVGDGNKQDRTFFQKMREGMESGGYRLLLRRLLDFNLAGIDLNDAPNTEALHDQKIESLDAIGRWWLDCLHAGKILGADFETTWGKSIECERFRQAFRRYARDHSLGTWQPSAVAFGRKLKKITGGTVVPTKARIGGVLENVYKLPEILGARAAWAQHIGHTVEWGE